MWHQCWYAPCVVEFHLCRFCPHGRLLLHGRRRCKCECRPSKRGHWSCPPPTMTMSGRHRLRPCLNAMRLRQKGAETEDPVWLSPKAVRPRSHSHSRRRWRCRSCGSAHRRHSHLTGGPAFAFKPPVAPRDAAVAAQAAATATMIIIRRHSVQHVCKLGLTCETCPVPQSTVPRSGTSSNDNAAGERFTPNDVEPAGVTATLMVNGPQPQDKQHHRITIRYSASSSTNSAAH